MAAKTSKTTFQQLLDDGQLEVGDGYRAQNSELGGTGPIFLRAGHVTESHIDLSGVERFHEHLAGKVRSKMSRPGDTIVTTKGNSTGRTAFVTERLPPFVYSPHLSYWRSRDPEKLCGGFLRYWSQGVEFANQLSGMKASTDMAPYLSLTDQRRLTITLPSIEDQRAIAETLGALDDKIELNRRMNITLEAMARALFQSWFVDFDPVRAKLDGRAPSGMDAATANLFPDGFESSERGRVPRGWKRAPLGDWATPMSGGTPSKQIASLWGGDVPWISPKVMTSIHADEADDFVTPSAVGNGTRLAPTGATLVMVRGMGLHQHVRVSQARSELTFNQDVKALVPKEIEATLLLFAVLTAQGELLGRVESSGHGTGKLPSEILLSQSITMPPVHIQKLLAPVFVGLNDRIASNRNEARTLATLRETLLPKLLSGELSVADSDHSARTVAS